MARRVMEACRLPKWPHEVLPGYEDLTPWEQRRMLSTFMEAEARFLEFQAEMAKPIGGGE